MKSNTASASPIKHGAARPQVQLELTRIRLWDLPLRLFHWSLVAAVLIAIVTAKLGGDWMELHGKAGLAILGLLAFRLVWGICGSTHARFRNFVPSPAKIRAYINGQWKGVGHSPLGALAVFTLLGLLAAQVVTGLFANDDIAFNGPLFTLIDKDFSDKITGWHHQLSNLLLALIGLHVVAIAFYVWVKKNNLVKPMVTGWKEVPAGEHARQGGWVALVASVLIAVSVVYLADDAQLFAHTSPTSTAQRAVGSPNKL
ncbi:MAG: cytochrome b/b6 domain-containing protein [Burkholderiaceae bacterium]